MPTKKVTLPHHAKSPTQDKEKSPNNPQTAAQEPQELLEKEFWDTPVPGIPTDQWDQTQGRDGKAAKELEVLNPRLRLISISSS